MSAPEAIPYVPNEPPPVTHEYVVVLRILVDGEAPWWEALGMTEPERLNTEIGSGVYTTVLVENEVKR